MCFNSIVDIGPFGYLPSLLAVWKQTASYFAEVST